MNMNASEARILSDKFNNGKRQKIIALVESWISAAASKGMYEITFNQLEVEEDDGEDREYVRAITKGNWDLCKDHFLSAGYEYHPETDTLTW
jgi:hypothetical protein